MPPSPLASANIEAQARLRGLTVAAVAAIWRDLPGYDRENVPQWLEQVLPVVSAAQRTSVALTDAYVARSLERQPIGVKPDDLIGAGARNGAAPAEVYERPFVTLWSKLGEGVAFDDAAAAALARASGTASMDVQLAMRGAADAIDTADVGFFGYTRVADGEACGFCQEVDGAYVKAADGFAMALHNGCGCGLEPNEEPHRGAVNLPDGTRIRAYQYGPLTQNVAVQEHGELGAVLVAAGDHFTSESDI